MVYWLVSLFGGKEKVYPLWEVLLFIKRGFLAGEGIYVPLDKVLQMHSPKIDGDLKIDGEVYIL